MAGTWEKRWVTEYGEIDLSNSLGDGRAQIEFPYCCGLLYGIVFKDLLGGCWSHTAGSQDGGTFLFKLTQSTRFVGYWHRHQPSQQAHAGSWCAGSVHRPGHAIEAIDQQLLDQLWQGEFDSTYGVVSLDTDPLPGLMPGAITGRYANRASLQGTMFGAAVAGVWRHDDGKRCGTFVFQQTCWGFEGVWSEFGHPVTPWRGVRHTVVADIAYPGSMTQSDWHRGELHTHVSGLGGRSAQVPGQATDADVNGAIVRDIKENSPGYQFVVAMPHDDDKKPWPDPQDPWSVSMPAVPRYIPNARLRIGTLMLAGLEQQLHAMHTPVEPVVHNDALKQLQGASAHLGYIEFYERGACLVHPFYTQKMLSAELPAQQEALKNLLEFFATGRDHTKTNALLLTHFEVYNDFAFMKRRDVGDASQEWDYLLARNRRVWATAGDCSFFFGAKNPVTPPQGRLGTSWVMVAIDTVGAVGKPTTEQILAALDAGRFYCTTGVYLRSISASAKTNPAGERELTIHVKAEGDTNNLHWRIVGCDFDHPGHGPPSRWVERCSESAPGEIVYSLTSKMKYVRVECRRAQPWLSDDEWIFGKEEQPYEMAWTQPFWQIQASPKALKDFYG